MMNKLFKKTTFIGGAFFATASILITKVLGLLYVIPFYKIIGESGGALYSYAYNIYTIFLSIGSAGIPFSISKLISEEEILGYREAKKRTLIIGLILIFLISIISFVLMFISSSLVANILIGTSSGGNSKESITLVIRVISLSILVIPILSVIKGYLEGHKIIAPTGIANIREQIVRISIILIGSFISYKILKVRIEICISISLLGCLFGGVSAIRYLVSIMMKNREKLGLIKYKKRDPIKNTMIIKKIMSFSLPFVFISIASGLYNFIDMISIMKGLEIVGFDTVSREFITSAMTTWANKICVIISAFSLGMVTSLVPNIAGLKAVNAWSEIENKMNKAYTLILFISVPIALGISALSRDFWSIFYGSNIVGTKILMFSPFAIIFTNIYTITMNFLESLNEYKRVSIYIGIGLLINAALDIPLMLLLNKLTIPPYYGAILASVIGYTTSIVLSLKYVIKKHKINLFSVIKNGGYIVLSASLMLASLSILNYILKLPDTIFYNFIEICTNALIGGIIYICVTHKLGVTSYLFGKRKTYNISKLDHIHVISSV